MLILVSELPYFAGIGLPTAFAGIGLPTATLAGVGLSTATLLVLFDQLLTTGIGKSMAIFADIGLSTAILMALVSQLPYLLVFWSTNCHIADIVQSIALFAGY